MALWLIDLTFTKLLSGMVLLARCDTAKEVEILACAINSPYSNDACPGRG